MSRRVELHPAAHGDLDRLAEFLLPLSERAALSRSKRIREKLRSLGDAPFKGRLGPEPDLRELIIRFGKSTYIARYNVTADAVVILRIWHGLENRPR